MAEENKIRPSEQILPGSFSDTVANNQPIPELSIADQFTIPLEDIPLEGAMSQKNKDMFNAAFKVNQVVMPEPPNLNTNGEDLKLDNDGALSGMVELGANRKEQWKDNIIRPTFFSVDDTNYERYYTNPNFAELGFTPYDPNIENLYNKNTSWWQDIVRATPYVWDAGGAAFFSNYRTIGDIFSGEIFEPDMIGGLAMADSQRIAGSTKGGVGGFLTNLYLNSGYTLGIIANIAVEELAILGGSAALASTGVGIPSAVGAATVGTGRQIYRFGRAAWNWTSASRYATLTSDMIKSFNSVDRARKFWTGVRTGENVVGKFFMPNTMRALRNLNTSKSALQQTGRLANNARLFGGFYRDMRAVNLALSESKMESALVVNEQIGRNLGALQGATGEYTDEDFRKAQANAADAGFSTLMWNWPLIYVTNNMILRTAFRGFNTTRLGKILNDTGGLHKNIRQTRPLKDAATGGLAKNIFEDVSSKGWKNTLGIPSAKKIGTWTAGGTTLAGAHGAARYFAYNIAEGGQEVYQEAVAVGAKDYYSQILEDPQAGDWNTLWASMHEGASSQMTGQGFETFMSGFLMGGLVRGPQKILFETLPGLIQQKARPGEYADYQKTRDDYVDKLVKVYNDKWNEFVDIGDFQFNPHKKAQAVMRQAADGMNAAELKQDPLGFYDEKDFIKFSQAYRLFETGGSPFFASAIGDIGNNLTDEELIQAFPMHEKDIKSGKYRDRLKETVQEINDMQDRFTLHNDKFKNKYDPNKFKPGTVAHTRESARWAGYEQARYLYLFAEESFKRALERTNKIYEGLATEPVFQDNSKIAANDIQVLAEGRSIQEEMILLAQEVEMLKETKGDNRKEIASKKKKMKALANYFDILTAKENQTKDGKRFSRTPANIKKLRKVFLEYVDVLAEEKGTYTNVNNIDASLRNLIDLSVLKDRSRAYERAVRFLADPSELDRLSDNMQNQFLFIFNNQIKYYKNSVKNKIAKQERAVLLRAFANLGVLPIPEEAEAFILSGDVSVLKTFQSKEGVITEESNPELYQAIQEKIENYRKLYNKNVEKPAEKKEDTQEQQPDPDFESARLDQQEDFDKASRDGQPLPAINTDIISEEEAIVLNRLYDKYAQGSTDEVLSEDEWLELTKTKRQYNAIKKLFDRYKADIKNIDDINKIPTFNQWFTKNRGENSIKSILALGGASSLQPSDFLPKEQKIEPKQLPSNQKRIKAGFNKDINLVRIKTTDQEGNEVAIYELQDNQGSILSDGILQRAGVENTSYVSIREGENAFNKVIKTIDSDVAFNFDGIELKYGDRIVDDKGQQYMVLGTPKNIQDGNSLLVKVLGTNKEQTLPEVGFSTNYKLDTRTFKQRLSPEKTTLTRIKSGELTHIYPDKDNTNSIRDVIKDPKFDINKLTFKISLNPARKESNFQIGNELKANPYIWKRGDKYNVEMIYDNKAIGYVSNDQYRIAFNNKPLDLNKPLSSLQFVFDINDKAKIENQYGSDKEFVRILDNLYTAGKSTVTLQELQNEGINFSINDDRIVYNSPPKSLDQYSYNTYDGSRLIITVRREKTTKKLIVEHVSDLQADNIAESQVLFEKALQDLDDNTNFNIQKPGYYAIINKPNGKVGVLSLDIKSDKATLDEVFSKIKDKSKDLLSNNVEKGKAKDKAAAEEFNKDLSNDIFVSSKPGSYTKLFLNALGDLILEARVDGNKQSVKVSAQELDEGKDMNELIKRMNEKSSFKFSTNNFKSNISKEAEIDEIVAKTQSTTDFVAPPVNRQMRYYVQSDVLETGRSAEVAQPKSTEVDLKAVEKFDVESAESLAPADLRVQELKEAKLNVEKIKKEVWASAKAEGISRMKALKDSKEYQEAVKKVEDIQKSFDTDAYKILQDLPSVETEKVDSFIRWAQENLPEFIGIKNINELGERLKNNGTTVGAFVMALNGLSNGMDIKGTIYVGSAGFRYHEAFHAVFRLLLTKAEQKQYYDIAKKELRAKLRREGKDFEQELQKFKNTSALYMSFSRARLLEEFYEEYMADEFEKFKKNPRSSTAGGFIKSFFTRLINWIKTVLGTFTKNELQTLFENIDAGKYKNATNLASNMFTDEMVLHDASVGISTTAHKILPTKEKVDETGRVTYEYLDANDASFVIDSMMSRTLALNDMDSEMSLLEIEAQVYDEYVDLYDPDNTKYDELDAVQRQKVIDISNALAFVENGIPSVSLGVRERIDTLNLKIDKQAEIDEVFEYDLGLRSTDVFDKDQSTIGGATALPMKVRAYMATTLLEETDVFGNKFLIDPIYDEQGKIINEGVRLIVPVDVDTVYNGVLKAVQNKETAYDILSSLYAYRNNGPHTKAFVDRLFNDMGIDGEVLIESGSLPPYVHNSAFAMQVIKSFQNARINYLFVQTVQGRTIFYSAATRDASKSQLDQWQLAYDNRRSKMKADKQFNSKVQVILKKTLGRLQATRTKLDNVRFDNEARQLATEINETLGIQLSPEYLKVSMLAAKPDNIVNKTKIQQKLLDDFGKIRTLTVEDVSAIKDIILADGNLYSKESGAESRLRGIAIGNAQLDENVGASTHTNANGDMVVSHQMPTFHTKMLRKMNEVDFLEELEARFPDNPLIKSEAFRQMSIEGRHEVLRLSGFRKGGKVRFDEELNEVISDGTKQAEVSRTYGDQSPKEFIENLISLYTYYYNTNKQENKTYSGQAISPVLIRVMEASDTGDMAALPISKTVELEKGKLKISQDTLDIFYKQIQNEYDRIVRESNEDTKTQDIIEDYNDTPNGRAYKLFNTRAILPDEVVELLEGFAKQGKPFAEAAALSTGKTNIFSVLRTQLGNEFNTFFTELKEMAPNKDITKIVPDIIVNGSQNEIADQQLNLLYNNVNHNLAQIYFNDKINTFAINELLLGDESLTLKDAVDQAKRAKGQNGAIRSVEIPFTDPMLGITHKLKNIDLYAFKDPTFKKRAGGPQDQTDAQVYYTEKGFRYFQFGIGNLTQSYADVLDLVKDGKKVPAKYVDTYAAKANAMNSKKFVYFDGQTYMKMSIVPLTKEFTSIKDENGQYTIPKANKVELHNLRVKMEEYEQANESVVVSGGTTALKMLKKNIHTADKAFGFNSIDREDVSKLEARFMGLQQVTPSNKSEATVGTQMRVLITAEQDLKEDVIVDGKKQPMKDVVDQYNKNIIDKLQGLFNKYETLLYPKGIEGPADLYTYLKSAQRNLKAGKYSSNIIDMFSVDDNGAMKYGTHAPFVIRDAERALLSMFNKTVDEKVPGTSATLMSDYGIKIYRKVYSLDSDGVPLEQEVIRENIIHKNGTVVDLDISEDQNIDVLRKEIEASNGKGVIVLDRLRSDMVDKDGLKYSEFVMPAMSASIARLLEDTNMPIPEFLSKVYGVRIPSQDKHSALNLRLVDFMPSYMGSTGVFAREILERSGADFDIDKIYLHMKELYEKNGKFYEYGKQGFDDYIQYVGDAINSGKPNAFKDAFEKFMLGSKKSDKIKQKDAITGALTQLNLPTTKEEFDKYEGPSLYPGANNNKDLELKYAMLGNKKITESLTPGGTPIIAEEAGLDRLKSVRAYMEEVVPEWAQKTADTTLDVNSLLGKFYSYKNNKEGAGNIGLAVKPNLAYSLLREYDIKLNGLAKFVINKKTATKFETMVDNKQGGKDRIASVFDELVSANVDNAKERLVSKLGLNRNNLPIAGAALAVGIPIDDVVLFINSPIFEEDTYQDKRDPYLFEQSGIPKITTTEILKTYSPEFNTLPKNQQAKIKRNMIDIRQRLGAISAQARNLGVLMNYMRGFGKDFGASLYQDRQIAQLFGGTKKAAKASFIINAAEDSFIVSNLKLAERFSEIAEKILPRFNSEFKKHFLQRILPQMSPFVVENKGEYVDQVALDYLAYRLISLYKDNLNNSPSKLAGTLSNSMIYGNSNTESVIDVVERLRKTDPEKSNYFLNNFVQTVSYDNEQNNDGLNKAVTNTFARLTDNQKIKVQNGFAMLYGNSSTRTDAVKLLHYIIVKDGLQFNTASLLQALSPYIIETFLDKTTNIFTNPVSAFDAVQFARNYFKSASAQKYLQQEFDSLAKPFGKKSIRDGVEYRLVPREKVLVETSEAMIPDEIRLYIRINNQLFEYDNMDYDGVADEVPYKLIPIEGSIAQNPIGFMFNDANFSRPAYKDIAKYNKTTDQISLEEFQEMQGITKAFETGSNVTANENGYTIEDAIGISEKAIEGYTIPTEQTEVVKETPKKGDIVTLEFYFEKENKITPVKVTIENITEIEQGGAIITDNKGNVIKEEPGTIEYELTLVSNKGRKYEVTVGRDGNITQFLGKNNKLKIGTDNYIPEFDLKSQPTQQNFEQADLEEQKPMAKSRVKELLKASQEVKDNKKLENFWDNEINNYLERKEKTGYNSYLDLENAYKEVADDISVEEFIENSVRCKF